MTTRAPLTPDRFQLLRALFDRALEGDASARDALLETGSRDAALREELESLLNAHDGPSGGWTRPAVEHLPATEKDSPAPVKA